MIRNDPPAPDAPRPEGCLCIYGWLDVTQKWTRTLPSVRDTQCPVHPRPQTLGAMVSTEGPLPGSTCE